MRTALVVSRRLSALPSFSLLQETLVFDLEWHWIFDCPMWSELRAKNPYLLDSIQLIRNNRECAEIRDLCKLLNAQE